MTPVYFVCAALLPACLPITRALTFAKVSDNDTSRYEVEVTGEVLPYLGNAATIGVKIHAVPSENDATLSQSDLSYAYCDGSVRMSPVLNVDDVSVDYNLTIVANTKMLSVLERKGCLRCSILVVNDTVSFCVNEKKVYELEVGREVNILNRLLSVPDHSPHIMWISVTFLIANIFVFVCMVVGVIVRDKRE